MKNCTHLTDLHWETNDSFWGPLILWSLSVWFTCMQTQPEGVRSQVVAGVRQGRARAAVLDGFVSMGSVFLSVCCKDVLASCSEDPKRKNTVIKLILADLCLLSSFISNIYQPDCSPMMMQSSSSSSSVSAWKPSVSMVSVWMSCVTNSKVSRRQVDSKKKKKQSSTLHLFGVATFLHVLRDGVAAGAFPLVGGCGGTGHGGRVSQWAGVLVAGDLSAGGEVGPLAGNRQTLLRMTDQNFWMHVPAASSVSGAFFVHGMLLYYTPDMDPFGKPRKYA